MGIVRYDLELVYVAAGRWDFTRKQGKQRGPWASSGTKRGVGHQFYGKRPPKIHWRRRRFQTR